MVRSPVWLGHPEQGEHRGRQGQIGEDLTGTGKEVEFNAKNSEQALDRFETGPWMIEFIFLKDYSDNCVATVVKQKQEYKKETMSDALVVIQVNTTVAGA